jgi:hypothetical protein
MTVRRGGRERYGGGADLSAEAALMLDDSFLYLAAKVADDVQAPSERGQNIWRTDSVQLGMDPILDRYTGNYGENSHEIGLALVDGRPQVWRWRGRRGQPVGEMMNVKAAVVREEGLTVYEAAVPLTEMMPFAPDAWPRCGVNIVINDADADGKRKGRLELVRGAMTHGKHPDQFAVAKCAPSGNGRKVSAGLVWERRCMLEGGAAEITMGISSPETREAIVRAELVSLDDPDTQPAVRELMVPVTEVPEQYRLSISSDSRAGRYRLRVGVRSKSGWRAAEDALNVYIYPKASYPE